MATDKAVQYIAEGLNEYADYMARDEDVPNHAPAAPSFWFYGLARETRALCRSPHFRAMLTKEARAALNAKPSAWARAYNGGQS